MDPVKRDKLFSKVGRLLGRVWTSSGGSSALAPLLPFTCPLSHPSHLPPPPPLQCFYFAPPEGLVEDQSAGEGMTKEGGMPVSEHRRGWALQARLRHRMVRVGGGQPSPHFSQPVSQSVPKWKLGAKKGKYEKVGLRRVELEPGPRDRPHPPRSLHPPSVLTLARLTLLHPSPHQHVPFPPRPPSTPPPTGRRRGERLDTRRVSAAAKSKGDTFSAAATDLDQAPGRSQREKRRGGGGL